MPGTDQRTESGGVSTGFDGHLPGGYRRQNGQIKYFSAGKWTMRPNRARYQVIFGQLKKSMGTIALILLIKIHYQLKNGHL
jgi:hypothetical protein